MATDTAEGAKHPPRHSRRRRMKALIPHLMCGLLLLVVLYPLLWAVLTSFKPTQEIIENTSLWPRQWTWSNFTSGWSGIGDVSFGQFFLNSLTIALFCVIGNAVFCTLAAYAFGRLEFRGRSMLFAVMIALLIVPKEVLLIPQYTIFNKLGWTDSFLPLIVPQFLALDSFFVFLTIQFLRGLPRSLDEAASLDGCGPFRRLWYITLPLLTPAISVTSVFTFLWTWNDYMPQLIYLNTVDNFTVSVGLRSFVDATSGGDLGLMSAMSLASLLPLFVLFVFFQRRIVGGITVNNFR
jgi:multiple sugar transport system permease protein